MSQPMKVTKITGKPGNRTFWYDGAEPSARKPPVNRGGYRVDVQKGRVYQAEREAFLGAFDGVTNRTIAIDLPELSDVRAYVKKICADRWFRRHFLFAAIGGGIQVTDGRGHWKAVASAGAMSISVARNGRARWVVLHEVAHCLTPRGCQAHGPEYVKIYLQLVRHFLGREAWRALYTACRAHKVKMQVRKRGRRRLSAEQRHVLVARLAHARAVAADRRAQEKAYELDDWREG